MYIPAKTGRVLAASKPRHLTLERVAQYRPSTPQSCCFASVKSMTTFQGHLKRSLSHNGFSMPDVDPLSDSSAASSSCCEAVGCPPSPLSSRPLHIPLEVGGDHFVPVIPLSKQKRVLFGDIEIRKYPIILGDHPECTMGPPVSSLSQPPHSWLFDSNTTNCYSLSCLFFNVAYNRLGAL
jgi:hypothetical protein